MSATLRDRLRAETRAEHERVDDAFGSLDLTCRGDYLRFLRAHEWAMRAVDAHLPGYANTRALLLEDIAALGEQPLDPEPGDAAGRLAGADATGIAYVVTGAHFGAAVLSRRVGRSADPVVRGASAYLGSTLMRERWPALRAKMEAASPQGARADAAVAGAVATFEHFHVALERTGFASSGPASSIRGQNL